MSGYATGPAQSGTPHLHSGGRRLIEGQKASQPLRHESDESSMAAMGSSGGPSGHTGQEYSNVSTTQKMISATFGSLLTSVLVTPLDVVRIRLQSQTPVIRVPTVTAPSAFFKELPPKLGVSACCREVFWIGNNAEFCIAGQSTPGMTGTGGTLVTDCLVEETQRKTFTSTLDGLRKIARNEGLLSLWRGLSPTLVMAIPANVIYFTGYDWLRFDRASPIARLVADQWTPLVAGSVARIAAASVISPIEMFRTRLQATSGKGTDHFKRTLQGLHQLTQAKGYGALWRGLTLTMWRDVPFSGFYWWGYEAVKNRLTDLRAKPFQHGPHPPHDNTITFVDSFIAGATSGAAAAFLTTPFDVGKTRQQVFRHSVEEAGHAPPSTTPNTNPSSSLAKFTSTTTHPTSSSASSQSTALRPEQMSIPRFLLHIFREEGLAGLFRGWAARCLKIAPACAIMISSYEIGKKVAGHANERRGSTS
ncbi:hypothetical protein VTO42DRAFT_2367 [Malbranchea cinnamomea]